MLQGRALLAVDEDRRLTGFDHEEDSAARTLLDDSFSSRTTALLEESRDLLDLTRGQIREQRHTLQGFNGRVSHHRSRSSQPRVRALISVTSRVMRAKHAGSDAMHCGHATANRRLMIERH